MKDRRTWVVRRGFRGRWVVVGWDRATGRGSVEGPYRWAWAKVVAWWWNYRRVRP